MNTQYTRAMKFLVSLLFILGSALGAASLEDAKTLFSKGEFAQAAKIAVTLESSAGYAFAARSLFEFSNQQPKESRLAILEQAEQYAQKAVKLDDHNADAYFELGSTAGQIGNLRGMAYAFASGVAVTVREHFEKAIALDPKHTSAMIALGSWHAEIVSRGVGFLYGGKIEKVFSLFDSAVLIAPKSITVRLYYAKAILKLDSQKYRDQARAQLEFAVKLEANDYLEKRALENAKEALVSLK
jgi:tetratricopeptide (TPR) repeat protein